MWIDKKGNLYQGDCCQGDRAATQLEIEAWELSVLPNYADLRRAEYPPITDFIDGVVKNDVNQIEAYKAACLAVKAKYPKP